MIRPCYYKGECRNKPYPPERMLRLYLVQNLYTLSDKATVTEAIDSRTFSNFCGVDSSNKVPDGDTQGGRNLLVRNGLQEKLLAQVVELLQARGLLLKKGTIVDSTIIAAPSSTNTGTACHFGLLLFRRHLRFHALWQRWNRYSDSPYLHRC